MVGMARQGSGQALSRVNGIKEISRRLKAARDGFSKMEKDLDHLLAVQPSKVAPIVRVGVAGVAGLAVTSVALPFAALVPFVGVPLAMAAGAIGGGAAYKVSENLAPVLRTVTGLIPHRGFQEWANSLSDPLALAERSTREHANDLQGGILGLKRVAEEMWTDQERIASALKQANEESWDSNRLFEFVRGEAESGNLPIDPQVAELMQARQSRLSEAERAAAATRIKKSIGEYLNVVDHLVQYIGTAGDEVLELLGIVVMRYVTYAKLGPVVAELRNTGLAMTSASEGVFASRELLMRHLQASHEAFMAAADAAEAMETFRIAGPEMIAMLQGTERQLATRLKALQAPRGNLQALPTAIAPSNQE